MSSAITTAVSGLNAHQKMLDVVGNNIANVNTIAFKSRRVLFTDMLYNDLRTASGATTGAQGSVNPAQIGTGVKIGQIDLNFAQGTIQGTGNALDVAIDGSGFFVVRNSGGSYYTRAGSFTIDETGVLIDPSTGYRVQRFGSIGEPDGVNPSFQIPGNSDIHIPIGAAIPGHETTAATIKGNLKSGATGPAAKQLSSLHGWMAGGVAATSSTLINSLDSVQTPYVPGDVIRITGSESDGTPVSVNFTMTATSTVGDLVSAIDSAFGTGTATLDASGKIVMTGDTTGVSSLSVTLQDATTNTGATAFASNPLTVAINGKEGDVVQGGIQVYDAQGGAHTVNTKFQKQADGTWTMTASLDSSEGTVVDGTIERITFNDDGSFAGAGASGIGDINLTFNFTGIGVPQTLAVGFGDVGKFNGLTQVASESSISALQDGFAPGALSSVQIGSDGVITGVASNGRQFSLGQLAIASFRNPDGLTSVGDSYYMPTAASGDVEIGTALAGSRGGLKSGQLEQSNVDLPQEFTDLIIAQRGFSANSRTVTVASQVLEELLQIVR